MRLDRPDQPEPAPSRWAKYRRWFWIMVIGLPVLFTTSIALQYRHLKKAFVNQEQFLPTQIYSDLTRIAPPQPRYYVEERLKSLGYSPFATDDKLVFVLHDIEYPTYLLPPEHATARLGGKRIELSFDGEGPEASLSSIEAQVVDDEREEQPDLFLEPERVANLSRGEAGAIRTYLKFDEIPSPLWQAIIAIEDQHYLDHKGLDPRGLARAILVNVRTMSFSQGGSTITQQLVKNLMARRSKNILKKFNELFLSLLLEANYEKEQILERYLNEVYLGQIGSLEVHGFAEGAKYFFGKSVDELNLAEISLMAGLIRGPSYYSPYRHLDRALERQGRVLGRMVETGQIAPEEAEEAKREPIRLVPPPTARNKAPWFTDYIKAALVDRLEGKMAEQEIVAAGFKVYTTLDIHLNRMAQDILQNGVGELERRLFVGPHLVTAKSTDELEGAIAVADHRTGYVRALVGGRNYQRSTFNRILNMRRQVGSTFKPLVYLTAFEKAFDPNGIPYGPGYPLDDSPWKLQYDEGKQNWAPENYHEEHQGWITMREAMINSVNIPAARLGVEIGEENIIKAARKMGVKSEMIAVPALSLGVTELSPLELLQVYATFANRGYRDEITAIRAITRSDGKDFARFLYHPKQVMDPDLMDIMRDMMTDVFTRGTAKAAPALGYTRPSAGKTGTTSDHRDAWFAGFTPELTTVVWVGLDRGSSVDEEGKASLKLTGAGAALPIWTRFMNRALKHVPPTPFPESEHLSEVRIDRHTGQKADSSCAEEQVVIERYIARLMPEAETCEPEWPASVPETIIGEPLEADKPRTEQSAEADAARGSASSTQSQ